MADGITSGNGVTRVGSSSYFYDGVEFETTAPLIRELRILNNEHISNGFGGVYAPIWLHINSGGGSLWDAFAIADTIKAMSVPVHSISEGLVASAATIIAAACHKRYTRLNTTFLIHQLEGGFWGTFDRIESAMKMYQMNMDQLVKFYMTHSHLSESQVKEMLSHDTWLSSQQMLDAGLIDQII